MNRKAKFQSSWNVVVDKDRGVRLMEQDIKVYEKTLEKRRTDIVRIDEKQFGF